MKKRVFSVLLAVMLVAASFSTAFAASGVTASASKTQVEVGDTFTVTYTVTVEELFSNMTFAATFDPEYVELVEWNVPKTIAFPASVTQSTNPASTKADDTEAMKNEAKTKGYYIAAAAYGDGNEIDFTKGAEFTATFKAIKAGDAKFGIKADQFAVKVYEGTTSIDKTPSIEGVAVTVEIAAEPCEHVWGEWETTVEATCAAAGVKERVCELCGEVDTEAIEALPHTWGEWEHTGELNEEGKCLKCTPVRTCTVCGATENGKAHNDNPDTGDTMSAVLFLAMAAMFVAGIVTVNKARKHA